MGKQTSKYLWKGTNANETLDGSTLSATLQARGLVIDGAGGNDVLVGGSGADILKGGNGDDTLIVQLDDLLGTPSGTLIYDGGRGSDWLDLSGIESAEGTGIYVGSYSSYPRIILDAGHEGEPLSSYDQYILDPAKDWVGSIAGIENVRTGDGDDFIYFDLTMGYGVNQVISGAGDDIIDTGDGKDIIDAGSGDDFIYMRAGDTVIGGEGSDVFAFGSGYGNVITDFDIASEFNPYQDRIRLWEGYAIEWDPTAAVLTGVISNESGVVGSVELLGLTYADAGSVPIYYMPLG